VGSFSRRNSASLVAIVMALAGPATAQVVPGPPGASTGVLTPGSGTASAPRMSMTFDLEGGYEDNSVQSSDGTTDPYAPLQSGYIVTGAGLLRYRVGQVNRNIEAIAGGSLSEQQITPGLPSYRLQRGGGSIQGTTTMGGRNRVMVRAGTSYEPTFLGTFDSLGVTAVGVTDAAFESAAADPPPAAAGFRPSYTTQRWLANMAAGELQRSWSPRQQTGVSYEGAWMQPTSGPGLESQSHSATAGHSWRKTSNTTFELGYRGLVNRQRLEDGVEQRNGIHGGEARVLYNRRLTPRRSILVTGMGGVVRVNSTGLEGQDDVTVTAPVAAGSLRLGVTSAWGVSISARRDVTVLYGMSSLPFTSGAAVVGVDATVARRLMFTATTGLSRGRNRVGDDGDYRQTVADVAFTYGFGAHAGLHALYSYNDHELRDIQLAVSSFPTRFTRHSVRVGMTLWLPLIGRF
jgi:hypothetical protein